jgi:adenine-specific DNA-methyltransferase
MGCISMTRDFEGLDKSNGIYFTPYEIVKDTINLIKNVRTDFKNILEPSCGSCQFIDILDSELKFETIYGVEKNEKIFQTINKLKFKSNVKLLNTDFLNYSSEILFDLIIGNPPYFVIPKKDVSKEYLSYFDGRPNIYSIFIIKCLKLLTIDGILAFVLPKNFLNCIYYNKLRKYIHSKFKILGIIDHSEKSYLETAQDTCVLIVQNDKTNNNNNDIFTIKKGDLIIFNTPENIEKINKLYEGSISLNYLHKILVILL